MSTKQALFDQAAVGILTQGYKSSTGTICHYRGPGGAKCALGFLIEDSEYKGRWDDGDSDSAVHYLSDKYGVAPGFLADLQCIHDTVSVSEWPKALARFARGYGLSTVAIDKWIKGDFGTDRRAELYGFVDLSGFSFEKPTYFGHAKLFGSSLVQYLISPKIPGPLLPAEEQEPQLHKAA